MMPPRRRTPCAALLGALLVTCVACGPEPIGGVVAPRQREFFMRASKHFDVEADLGALAFSKEPIDVLLLFDRTASMSNVIREAQVRAVELVGGIASLYPNAAFAVAGLADYFGGERAWVLYQDVTTDRTAVESGLGQISEASGGDYPEAYARALQEARSIGWRPGGGKKYVILFGDAPAHDPTFYGVDFGVDAGRDGIRGTSDDLRLEPVVADLARDSVVVLAIYDGSSKKPYRDETIRGFEFMARQTGGVSVPLSSATDVVNVIRQSLRRVLRPAPVHSVPAAYASWVRTAPFDRNAPSANAFHAAVTIDPPDDTPAGVYRFPLAVVTGVAEGADTVGRTSVTVRIGALYLPWRLPLLLAFLASVVALSVSRCAGRPLQFSLYVGGRPLFRLLSKCVAVGLVAGTALVIWRYAPGTLPPPPAPVGRDPAPTVRREAQVAAELHRTSP